MKKNILIWIIVLLVVAAGVLWYTKGRVPAPVAPEGGTLGVSDDTTSINKDLQGLNDTSTLDNEFQSIDKDLDNL